MSQNVSFLLYYTLLPHHFFYPLIFQCNVLERPRNKFVPVIAYIQQLYTDVPSPHCLSKLTRQKCCSKKSESMMSPVLKTGSTLPELNHMNRMDAESYRC